MTTSSHRHGSTRLVVRHIAELMLARGRRWQSLGPRDTFDSIVFGTVLSASVAHLPLRDPDTGRWFGIEDAASFGRPVTAAAIAQSMQLPATTVRRRAAKLVAAGLLVREDGGFRVSIRCFAGEQANTIAAYSEDFVAVLTALAQAGLPPAVQALASGVPALPPGVIERSLLAFFLRTMEPMIEKYGDVVAATVISAIIAANVRHITLDPLLAARYGGDADPPGDDLRRPVTIRVLARAIDIPFETVRRRIVTLVAAGWVLSTDAGVVVPTRVLNDDIHIAYNRRQAALFEQMLQQLIAIADHYNA